MYDMAALVGHDLKLDMVRIDDQLLDIHVAVPKSLLGLMTRAVKTVDKAGLIVGGAHSSPAPTSRGFDHDRITDFFRDPHRFHLCFDDFVASRCHRHAGFARTSARCVFISQGLHRA